MIGSVRNPRQCIDECECLVMVLELVGPDYGFTFALPGGQCRLQTLCLILIQRRHAIGTGDAALMLQRCCRVHDVLQAPQMGDTSSGRWMRIVEQRMQRVGRQG